jgi:polysaccharide export outer membrane protein
MERAMRRLALLILFATACAGARPASKPIPHVDESYRLGREDVVEVVVWREPDLSRVVPVRPDGRIGLPLVGDVDAAGKTPAELRQAITQRLEPLVKNVSVAVLVREVNGAKFYVLGEVGKPGAYPLRSAVTVVQALATAGGLGEFAGNRVVWLKQSPAGGANRVELSYRQLLDGDDVRTRLGSGDVIYVP